MPTHVLIAHLAVIVAPVAALIALVYAVRPSSRRGMRWPLVVSGVAAVAISFWASTQGSALYQELTARAAANGTELPAAVFAHGHGSDVLLVATFALAVVVLALVWWLLAPGRRAPVAGVVAAGVLAVAALGTLGATWVVLEQAIQAVWSTNQVG